jgi:uncharacterized membrane protein YphA (DoxX/SURF4 family)
VVNSSFDEVDPVTRESHQRSGGARPSKGLVVGLWVVQALLAVVFVGTGLWKLLTPVPKLAAMIPWAGQVSEGFLDFTGVVDLLGGLGLMLPALTRIKPGLTVLAALGCALLQMCAIGFHVSRGEASHAPFNFLLVALSIFVLWGRGTRAPIRPRA